MLKALAMNNSVVQRYSMRLLKKTRMLPANPLPVTRPMRAHISCTVAISGSVQGASHNMPKPYLAPTCE